MTEKGFLSKKDERWLRRLLDHVCVMRGFGEIVDGPGFGVLISIADNYLVEKYVSQKDIVTVRDLISVCKSRDVDAIKLKVNEILNVTNPLVISMEQAALTFIMAAIYEWADNLSEEINKNKNI